MSQSELLEVVLPRVNVATLTAAENLLAALSHVGGFSLELAATREARRFLVRAPDPAVAQDIAAQLGVAYPQAALRRLDGERQPDDDPARRRPEEQCAACALVLRNPPYLPLRTFKDEEADPVLGLLGALGDLPVGWRRLAQLLLCPAPDDWCRPYLRLAVEHPLAAERVAAQADTSLTSVYLLGGCWRRARSRCRPISGTPCATGCTSACSRAPYWRVGPHSSGCCAACASGRSIARSSCRRSSAASPIMRSSASRSSRRRACRRPRWSGAWSGSPPPIANTVWGPATASCRVGCGRLHELRPLLGRSAPLLTTRELAGLWHLPPVQTEVSLIERTTARQRLPLPFSLRDGCPIGRSTHQGRSVPVALPDDLLRRHLLLVAKTRRGKSSLLLGIARHLMDRPAVGGQQPMLVLVDPHRDLARAALGLVPPHRRDAVVYLDVAEQERPFGLNLLDTGLGWDRDKAVANALAIFRREFD